MKRQPSRVAPLIATIVLPLSLSCKRRPADSVYVVGDMKGQATLWKNGEAQKFSKDGLGASSPVHSIFVKQPDSWQAPQPV